MVFLILYIISFNIVINSDDWFLIWLGMEINMMSFIFLIYERVNLLNIESCFKYFFVQSLSSVLFMSMFYMKVDNLEFLGMLVLSLKIGGGPFYFWFPFVCLGISWESCFLLMTFQKLIPLMLMFLFMSWVVWIIIISSLWLGVFGSFNQLEMKLLMAYSSIHHVGWMVMCMMMKGELWLTYLFVYGFMLIPMFYLFSKFKINLINKVNNMKLKLWVVILMLNMGGMPPMVGFFLKWLGFYYILSESFMLIFLMILMSMIMFYVYLRVGFNLMMGNKVEVGWLNRVKSIFYVSFDFLMLAGMVLGGMVMGFYIL